MKASLGKNWNADDGTSVALTLQLSAGVDGAQAAFHADVGTIGVTVTGVRAIPDLGDEAVASYSLEPGAAHVQLYVLSGNAELEIGATDLGLSFGAPLSRAEKLAADTALTRDVLARLHQA
ncbi:MAG TPA: hypothetical protein VFX25_07625 [Streptosporangiaceae bacterium]|nr:hypothetical protein [Streptosporangiaceae bacterium]HEX5288724.1 hypothetical protein [Streptosporangiaceae bacterium]